MDEKSQDPINNPIKSPPNNNQMKAILTSDGSIKLILQPKSDDDVQQQINNEKFLLKEISMASSYITSKSSGKHMKQSIVLKKPINTSEDDDTDDTFDDDDDESEFKFTPRQTFMAGICQVCKVNLSRHFLCDGCKMVSYCKEEHLKIDYLNHKELCLAIQLIAKRRGGHIYNMAKHLNPFEFRNLRIHAIFLCEQFLNRTLQPFEREILYFPRLCHDENCREWRPKLLSDCNNCEQVSHCAMHPLTEHHKISCRSFALYQKIILRQKSYGRVEVSLPHRVIKQTAFLNENVEGTLKLLYKNITAYQEDYINATLMHIATAPLTTYYAYQKLGFEFSDTTVIHLVGAELQFEADTLDKWEAFFMHLAPHISDLQIIFIGPELNSENLPVDIIRRTRMCRSCRQQCRFIRFDFQCKKFYHDYCDSPAYVKPNIVCFFNSALHRPGFRGFDTWPKTIRSAIETSAPILVTSCAQHESFLDFERIKNTSLNEIDVLQQPTSNPYASTRPERNFASDDVTPLIFKNHHYFVIRKSPNSTEL